MERDELGVGQRIRTLRKARGLRLKDVARAAECSESNLSKIENGLVSPSINSLNRIARALGTDIGELFASPHAGAPFVLRAGRRSVVTQASEDSVERISSEILTPFELSGLLQGELHTVEPGGESEARIGHAGEELGYVIEGIMELVVDDTHAVLGPGDSFFFASGRLHTYRNAGDRPVRMVWVTTPPRE